MVRKLASVVSLAVLSMACQASAYIQVTSASITHTNEFNGVQYYSYSSSSPGNVFGTYSQGVGINVSIGATSGSVLAAGTNVRPPGSPWTGYNWTAAGTIYFTAIDGTFSPTFELGPMSASTTHVVFTITDLATNQFRSWTGGHTTPTSMSGTLSLPAGPGNYRMDVQSLDTSPAISGYGTLNFAITPEPSTAMLICSTAALGRSRRR